MSITSQIIAAQHKVRALLLRILRLVAVRVLVLLVRDETALARDHRLRIWIALNVLVIQACK